MNTENTDDCHPVRLRRTALREYFFEMKLWVTLVNSFSTSLSRFHFKKNIFSKLPKAGWQSISSRLIALPRASVSSVAKFFLSVFICVYLWFGFFSVVL